MLAYLDDVVILCAAPHLQAAYQRYVELMAARGIPNQARKSEYWARTRLDSFPVPFAPRPRVKKLQVTPRTAIPDATRP